MKLILGVGNPILGDDAAGLIAAQKIAQKIPKEVAEVKEFNGGSIYLFDELLGYDEVILIDTLAIKGYEEGEVVQLDPLNIKPKVDVSNGHDLPFHMLLEVYRTTFPELMPKKMCMFGIITGPQLVFKEGVSKKIERAIDNVVSLVLDQLEVN